MRSKALAQNNPIQWGLNHGRNGNDIPSDVSPEMSCESINVEIGAHWLGRRRNGSTKLQLEGVQHAAAMMARFSPAQDDTAAELHLINRATPPSFVRIAPGANAVGVALTTPDEISDPQKATSAVVNGKLYWAYNSPVNRLHVYDPTTSTTAIRRAGVAAPTAAPIVIDSGGGTYPAVLRYYRVRIQTRLADGTLQRESEPSGVTPFTPSGLHSHAAIGRPPLTGQAETHWTVEASADNQLFFIISPALSMVSVDTYLDSALVDTYASHPAAPPLGTRSAFPSVKFLAADENRLLGFGVWETEMATGGGNVPPRPGRVYFTPVLDSTDQDDDERIDWGADAPGFIDVGRNRGYEDRALAGPLDGQFFAFQSRGIHMLVPTGDNLLPFRRVTLTHQLGAVSHWSTFIGEDETGAPALYFLDPRRGPYRYGRRGLEWCGYDMLDLWGTGEPDTSEQAAHGYYDAALRACIWFINSQRCLVFFVERGVSNERDGVRRGWVEWFAERWFNHCWCSVSFPVRLGASMSRQETGYIGTATDIIRLNDLGAQSDLGDPFRATVLSPAYSPPPRHVNKQAGEAYMQARASGGASGGPVLSIEQQLIRNFGDQPPLVRVVDLTPPNGGGATRVFVKWQELTMTDAHAIQVRLGDAAPIIAPPWTIDEWMLTFEQGDER